MNRRRSILIPIVVLVAAVAITVVATASSSTDKKKPAGTLQVRQTNTNLGKVLVDAKGRTLYELSADGKNKSTCSGACAANWPPAKSPAKPTVGSGVTKAKLKVITRDDGSKQLSYAGHPLYRFA